jgi:cell division protein FtsB
MRVLLGVLVVVSIGIFANSVMRYNALLEEQRELEHKLASYEEMKEELQELLNSDYDYEYIVKIAKEQLGLYFPDEEIFYNDRNE